MGLLSKAAAKSSSKAEKTVPDKQEITRKEPPEPETISSGAEESQRVKRGIIQYQKGKQDPFQGIVFDLPGPAGKAGDKKFLDRLSDMILCFGTAISLPAGRSLVLMPSSLDRELIVHRISHSLNTPSLGAFRALDPDEAMKELQPFF